jgi:hypothetical protein
MISTQSIIATVFLLCWLAFAYKPWLRPKEYLDFQKRRRLKTKPKGSYSPQSITFSIFKYYPNLA